MRDFDLMLFRGIGVSVLELFAAYYVIRWFCYKLKTEINIIKALQSKWKPLLFIIGCLFPILNLSYWTPEFSSIFEDCYVALMLCALLMGLEALLSSVESSSLSRLFSKVHWSIGFGILRGILYTLSFYYSYRGLLQNEITQGGFFMGCCCTGAVYMCLKFMHGFIFEDAPYRHEMVKSFFVRHSAWGYCAAVVLTALYGATWIPEGFKYRSVCFKYLSVAFAIILFSFIIEAVFVFVFDYFLKEVKKKTVSKLVQDLSRLISYVLLIMIILTTAFNVNLSSLMVGSTVISVILGLALQETMGNLIAGLLLNFAKPYKSGDYIDISGIMGTVEKVDWRSTVLRLISGERYIVPNSSVAKSTIKNFSEPSKRQARTVMVGADYKHSPDFVRRTVKLALNSVEGVLHDPSPSVLLAGFEDSSISYKIVFWIEDFGKGLAIESQVREAVWYHFSRENINIPFPITTVIKAEPEESPEASKAAFIEGLELMQKVSDKFKIFCKDSLSLKMFGPGETIFPSLCADERYVICIVKSGELSACRGNSEKSAVISCGDIFAEPASGENSITVKAVKESVLLCFTESQRDMMRSGCPEDFALLDKCCLKTEAEITEA